MEGDQKIDLQISFEREVSHHWSDVVGMQDVKEAIREAICLPLLFPQLFKNHRIPWKTILLFGAPGVGKTFVATSIPE
jgi:vacuolar protein-sorting-associated protein 4